MKKIFIIVILCLFLPFNCLAASKIHINYITLDGPVNVEEGKYVTFYIGGSYAGFNKTDFGVQGIYAAGVLFEFDEDVLILTKYEAESYNSVVIKEDGLAYLYSEVDDSTNNKCADGFFNCEPYSAKLTFYVKDTAAESTTIKVHSLEFGVYEVLDDDEFNPENLEEVICNKSKSINLNIIQNNVTTSPPASAISDSDSLPSNSGTVQKKDSNSTDSGNKSDNNDDSSKSSEKKELKFLKSLNVKGYKFDFDNNKSTYEIVLDSITNKLNIEAIPYSDDTSVKVVGADDLKAYSDIVKVRVELVNGKKMTYIINIKRESLSSSESTSIINKLNSVVYCVLGVVAFIVFIVLISSFRDKRKLKKLLQKSENEVI